MIALIGTVTINTFVACLGLLTISWEVFIGIFSQIFRMKFRFKETIDQMYIVGVQSLPIISFSLLFISVMMILEFSFHMKLVLRQDSLVPAFSTVLMLRELGPVVTSLLLASKMGAGIAAEIGTMKVTDQLDALKLLAVDPVEYLTIPRWFACVFGTVSLSVVSVGVSILGGAAIASLSLGYSVQEYFSTMFLFARYNDFLACVTKAAAFGTIIPISASYYGMNCRQGSEGVGEAATSAVVLSSMLIIVADFLLTYLIYAV